jgi:hypothetical protein
MIASGRLRANHYALLATIALLSVNSVFGQTSPSWKSGAALDGQLKQQFSVQWQERPLRLVLERLSAETGAAVFLDRRIDPDQLLTLATTDMPLIQLYERIAAEAGAGACRLGSVTYIGPPKTTVKLPAIAAQRRADAAKLPAELRSQMLKSAPCGWPDLAEPKILLDDLTKEAGLSVNGGNAVPHDLWPAVDLPPLVWTDRLTIVLAGFDLTFEIEAAAKALKLIPMPNVTVATPQPRTAKASKAPGKSVYSLRAAGQPAGNVLKTIAESLDKKLSYDPALLEKLRQPVTFDSKGVTLEELLETTLAGTELSYEITDSELQIISSP